MQVGSEVTLDGVVLEIKDVIGTGASSVVYRAVAKGVDYALKVITPTASTDEKGEGGYTEREAAVLARIRHPAVARIVSTGEIAGSRCIVMEYCPWPALSQTMNLRGAMPEALVLGFAVSLVSVLEAVHALGVVHRDIKPENILVTEGLSSLKLLDFGLAERVETLAKSGVVGTLRYASPEQLGVTRHTVTERSDLYSVGVIVFEMLTGTSLFSDGDVTKLLSAKSLEQDEKLATLNSKCAKPLVEILRRLLAKDPQKRHESAEQLRLELQSLLAGPKAVEVDTHAAFSSALLKRAGRDTPIFGRSEQLSVLSKTYAEVTKMRGKSILISGAAGAGKTRLVREFLNHAQAKGALLLPAKCVFGDPLAYTPLRASFALLSRALEQNGDAAIRDGLREVLGEYVDVVSFLAPRLLQDLELTPSAVPVESDQVANALTDVLIALSRRFSSVILFVDDIQWLDEASRGVLRTLASRLENSRVLLIATARVDEKNEAAIAAYVQDQGQRLSADIKVDPLTRAQLNELISYFLCTQQVTPQISDYLFRRTGGVPFIADEVLHSLLEMGMLRFSWGEWSLDEKRAATVNLSESVYDLILNRTKDLPQIAANLLAVAACIGTEFSTEILAHAAKVSSDDVALGLAHAVKARLLEPVSTNAYGFVHDRVREAFANKPEDEKQNIHAAIASAYLLGKKDKEGVYRVAQQVIAAGDVFETDSAYLALREAAILALREAASHESYAFGIEAERRDPARFSKDAELLQTVAESCVRTFRPQAALGFFYRAYEASAPGFARAKVQTSIARVLTLDVLSEKFWAETGKGFKDLGVKPPQGQVLSLLGYLIRFLWISLLESLGLFKPRVRPNPNEQDIALGDLLEVQVWAAAFLGNPLIIFHSAIGQFLYGVRSGEARAMARAYLARGFTMGALGLTASATKNLRQAEKLCEYSGDRETMAFAKTISMAAYEFSGNPILARRACIAGHPLLNWAKSPDIYYLLVAEMHNYLRSGDVREALATFDLFCEKLPNLAKDLQTQGDQLSSIYAFTLELAGRPSEEVQFHLQKAKDSAERTKSDYFFQSYATYAMAVYRETHEASAPFPDELVELWKAHTPMPAMMVMFNIKSFYYFRACLLLDALEVAKDEHKLAATAKFREALNDLRKAQKDDLSKGYYFTMLADWERYRGNLKRAHKYFERAAKFAARASTLLIDYEIHVKLGKMLRKNGEFERGTRELERALALAERMGWQRRATRLAKEFSLSATSVGSSSANRRSTTSQSADSASNTEFQNSRTLNALLQVSLVTSRAIETQSLIRNVLDETLRLMGAERAFFFVADIAGSLTFLSGRNSQNENISAADYSTTIIQKVKAAHKAIIVSSTEQGVLLGSQSVVAYDLKSIIAAPVRLRDELRGIIYLDNSVSEGVFTEDDIDVLFALSNQIAAALESSRLAEERVRRTELEKDLALSGAVQSLLFPPGRFGAPGHVALSGFCRPAVQSGGDWWWYDEIGSTVRVVVGDVTGHGAGSAMVTAVMAGCFQTLRRFGKDIDGATVCIEMNKALVELKTDYRMTFGVVEIDTLKNELRFWSAGSPPICVLSATKFQSIVLKGLPLGSQSFTPQMKTFALKEGDRVFMFTDGLIELRLEESRLFGMRGIQKMLQENSDAEISDITARFEQFVTKTSANKELEDDVTFVAIDVPQKSA